MADFSCDASEMRTLNKTLARADKAAQVAFYASLETAGHLVAAKAEQNIRPYSKTIAGTGRVVRRGTVVRIAFGDGSTGSRAFPTKAFENRGRPGKFRHPVFGDAEVWRDQEAHPFLIPAAHEVEPAVIGVVNTAIETAFSRLGF